MVASAGLFGLMALGTRLLSARIPSSQIALVRFATGIAAVAGAVLLGRAVIRPRRWGWLLARGVFGGLAVLAYYSCIEHVGVGLATLLNYTAPVWSLLLAWFLLGERPRRTAVAALALTLGGVILVLGGADSVSAGWWKAAGVFSAIASAVAITSIRAVRRRGEGNGEPESAWTVFASFTVIGSLTTLPWAASQWIPPTPPEWALLLAVAAVSIAAQLIMTRALAHVTAASSGIVHQLTVVVAMLGGVLLFGETLSTKAALGSVLTATGVAWVILASGSQRRAHRLIAREPPHRT
jgi:drug/metabolite transporter (DMT)-like permease